MKLPGNWHKYMAIKTITVPVKHQGIEYFGFKCNIHKTPPFDGALMIFDKNGAYMNKPRLVTMWISMNLDAGIFK